MKKIFLAALSVLLFTTITMAQQQGENKNQQNAVANDEHLMMKEGKMYHNVTGKEMMLENPMTMPNGTVIHPDGSYQLKNGKQRKLLNGQCMDMNGKKYRSHQMFQKSVMRTQGANMHAGSNHLNMNMSGHH
ncbi:hypothetical protein A3860_34320 [Niastella vici]|uniref:DUF6799 domain-containing protein n=1 Tax=Niastella vici TaxID=1703345 RepID=A0A1V9FP97_9BACT|nr:DUF6799 domain-containing protein [Niastella vici]OQP60158.1 hypothetical protein A3860_34320 [Niastella vici]